MAQGRYMRVSHRLIEGQRYSLIVENWKENDEFILFEAGLVASMSVFIVLSVCSTLTQTRHNASVYGALTRDWPTCTAVWVCYS
jgi:hypothetical protein